MKRLWLLLCFLPSLLMAQDTPEFGSDRPGLGDSTGLVGKGVLQLELGVVLEAASSAKLWAIPQPLLRFGLTDRLELRLGADGLSHLSFDDVSASETGVSDFTLGAKFSVLQESQSGFDLALLPVLSIPSKDDPFSSRTLDPTVEVLFSKGFSSFGLAGNVNFGLPKPDDERALQMAAGLAVDRDLSEAINAFVEIYVEDYPLEDESEAALMVDGGGTLSLGPDQQLDLSGGIGLSDAASDWFIGFGWVRRFR